MANCGKDILTSLEGTAQQQRYYSALEPDSFELNHFQLKDWMQFALQFAEYVNFFNSNNDIQANGNWQAFFEAEPELQKYLDYDKNTEELQKYPDEKLKPHLTLFLSFVKLMEISQGQFNLLTKKHLDFYYEKILGIKKQEAIPDQVHILFELAKRSSEQNIVAGSQLDAGKDANANPLHYKTEEDLVVNHAQVAQISSIYNDPINKKISAAEISDSFNGKGEDFPDDNIKWWPFGHPELDNASIGFSVSSEILQLKEGNRSIDVEVRFKEYFKNFLTSSTDLNLKVYCTGEDGWIGPFKITYAILEDEKQNSFFNGPNGLKLSFELSTDDPAIADFNSVTHQFPFNTKFPVCRFVFKTEEKDWYSNYTFLKKNPISEISINVKANEIESVLIENDLGKLNAEKPFYPFGTQPIKGSHFTINYSELFNKNWNELELSMKWKNTPDNFKTWYKYYDPDQRKDIVGSSTDVLVKGKNPISKKGERLFKEENKSFEIAISNNLINPPNGPILLSLNHSFLHREYPKLMTEMIIGKKKVLPNEPYTPLAENIRLSYTASTSSQFGKTQYASNPVKLFHEYAFGQSEQHSHLKDQLSFIANKKIYLLSSYCEGGSLYIGIEAAKKQQIISFLVQLKEGTENPKKDGLSEGQKIIWSVLIQNEWMKLKAKHLIKDETDNFLRSGIVQISLPRQVNSDNTLMPLDLIWIKAELPNEFDTVSQAISIQSQAVKAVFSDQGDEILHPESGLPAETISKMKEQLASIKKVKQPYSSFGGREKESDRDFYRRVSERLRHKNRAVSLWDYEHIILQEFPDVYKVKCLNHTSQDCNGKTSYLSPGHVLLVVIPDILDKNTFDILQPRLSKTALNDIQSYIQILGSEHIKTRVINPVYEEIQIKVDVKFLEGYDESYYQSVLEQDIIRMLSPWAFDQSTKIQFNHALNKSKIVQKIETLNYVDYISKLKILKQRPQGGYDIVQHAHPSKPEAIIVSTKTHDVSIVTEECNKPNETLSQCQK